MRGYKVIPACDCCLSGLNDHDPRKWKAPAFSFGTRHRQLKDIGSPGPCYLVPSNMTRTGRDGNPVYSLYSRPKDPQLFQTPGPGRNTPLHTQTHLFTIYSSLKRKVLNRAFGLNFCRDLSARESSTGNLLFCPCTLTVC